MAMSQMTPEQAGRLGVMLDRALWLVTGLVCTYSLVNVHGVAVHHGTGDPQAWLLAPIVDIALIAAIRADSALSTSGAPPGPWAAALRWFAGLATWTLNVWDALFPLDPTDAHGAPLRDVHGAVLTGHIDPGAVVSHSVPPVVLILLAEAAVAYRRAVAELVRQGEDEAAVLRQAQDAQAAAEAARADLAGELEAARADQHRLAGELATTAGELEAARAADAAATSAHDQALAELTDLGADRERLAAAVADAVGQNERARAEQAAALGELDEARAAEERLSRELADTGEALTTARAELDAALSREASRAAAAKAAGKDPGKGGGLAGWTGEATERELAILAGVLDEVQVRRTGRRLTYSAAQAALGLRYDAAKTALTAAREGARRPGGILPGLSPDTATAGSNGGAGDADVLPMHSPGGLREREPDAAAGGAR